MRLSLMLPAVLVAVAACDRPVGGTRDLQSSSGSTLFARHCAACHGQFGEGDGPVAFTMNVAVPNLRMLSSRENGQFPRESVIRYIDGRDLPAAHGDRYMPVWGDVFRLDETEELASDVDIRERIEALTDYLERIQS